MLARTFVFVFVFETGMYSTDALVTQLWPDLWLSHVVVSGRRTSSWDSKVTLSWWTTCSQPEENITSDYCCVSQRCTSGVHYMICFVIIVHNKMKVLLGAFKGCSGPYTPQHERIGKMQHFFIILITGLKKETQSIQSANALDMIYHVYAEYVWCRYSPSKLWPWHTSAVRGQKCKVCPGDGANWKATIPESFH